MHRKCCAGKHACMQAGRHMTSRHGQQPRAQTLDKSANGSDPTDSLVAIRHAPWSLLHPCLDRDTLTHTHSQVHSRAEEGRPT
jgi:hypothetical protein